MNYIQQNHNNKSETTRVLYRHALPARLSSTVSPSPRGVVIDRVAAVGVQPPRRLPARGAAAVGARHLRRLPAAGG